MNNINTKALTTIGVSADYIMSLSENVKLKKDLIEYPKFSASVPIRRMCEQLISSGSGVYFFHDLRGIHYIGETSDLKSRFKSHIKREKNKKLVKVMKSAFGEMNFSWVKTSSKMEALIYQKKWIRLFKPKCNEIFYKNN
jgi:predicted GIY-YIG superfamily endonuclease